MRHYDLTEGAENDIRQIVRYTLQQWGERQVRRYEKTLTAKLQSLIKGDVAARPFSENLSDVLVTQCEHHYIFYITRKRQRPLIIAILHERQDIVARLADRI